MELKRLLQSIEGNKYLNLKTILALYLITRILIVLVLNYGSWGGVDMLCYTVDCKFWMNNAQQVVNGFNPYQVWREAGGYATGIEDRADDLPVFFILISTFLWTWKSVWAVRLVFFIFDFINVYLIYRLAKFKRISVVLYILAPSILRGLLFPEDELLVTFALASIYFLSKRRYSLSTIMLVFWFNVDFYPIVFFPALLLNMDIVKKIENKVLPTITNYKRLAEQTVLFISAIVVSHIFYFPDWYMAYEFRSLHYALSGHGFGIWSILSTNYYPLLMALAVISFYILVYLKRLDITTGYFLGTLVFISIFPRFSVDHLITLVPLFLIWTRLKFMDIILWIFLGIAVFLSFLALPTLGIFDPGYAIYLLILVTLGFYLTIMKQMQNSG